MTGIVILRYGRRLADRVGLRIAGHATTQTTVDQYGDLLLGDDESAQLIRETLDGRLRGSG